jgi:hypothetical protein
MMDHSLSVTKGRCKYRYAIEGDNLAFSFSKGNWRVEESYPLAELSSALECWRGYPRSTKENLLLSGLFLLAASAIFVFANGFWIFGLAFIFEAGRRIVFEAEFLLPAEFTVISYRNGCDCLYMQRERGGEEKRLSFESALKNAIEKSK